ncbi:MAG: sigma-70 family RNA polymerase sigma factor [Pseudomonadota bacterium]
MGTDLTICRSDELIELVKAGDLDALDHITRCFGDRLLGVGRQRCRNEEDAHDAVQDTLLNAGRNLRSFRGDGSLEGWLVRMVANACYRMRRGRKNDPALHTTEAQLFSGEESPEQATARGEVGEVLQEVLLSLSPEDRAILMLAEGEGWTGPEISQRMSLSPGAVRTRLTRIRQRLRKSLEPVGVRV